MWILWADALKTSFTGMDMGVDHIEQGRKVEEVCRPWP